jgi:hypothetical protein
MPPRATTPRLHAIFHRQIRGDLALLQLAQVRFQEAGLGAEFYPTSPEELAGELAYRPDPSAAITIHLPRHLQVFDRRSHDIICEFAARFGQDASGLVVHDQPEMASRFDEYVAAARELDARLERQGAGPLLFIEYAAGLATEVFVTFFEAIRDCRRLSCCIDMSHIGIRQCQRAFEKAHPGRDVCHLKWTNPALAELVGDVQAACGTALPVVCQTISAIARLGKPLHFHLHDAHPSSTFSTFGVSDHLSFFQEIPIPFAYQGSRTLPLLFGPLGLERIVQTARSTLADELLSMTLEIHPPEGRLDLGPHAGLFEHWRDKENAERTNYWIEVLLRCYRLLRQACVG